MLKLLIACADYPRPNGDKSLYYVHTRNLYYVKNDCEICVLNFAAKEKYEIDNIQVYSPFDIPSLLKQNAFDILVCHAPNLRNHFLFLLRYKSFFKKKIFIFHGHEVLKINEVYSKPYDFVGINSFIKRCSQNLYDAFKLKIWKYYFLNNITDSYFVFVSNWMYNEFFKWTKIPEFKLKNHSYITYNSVGNLFETISYDIITPKCFDFITIRGNLDNSKYAIDVVNNLAINNPSMKFLLIGKGDYFKHFKKADNIEWIEGYLNHDEIISYLNISKCALMPTRTDAQGVMMCEMATFGIPLITSNISVCQDVFKNFTNVAFIDNDNSYIDLSKIIEKFDNVGMVKNTTYFESNTTGAEVSLFKGIDKQL